MDGFSSVMHEFRLKFSQESEYLIENLKNSTFSCVKSNVFYEYTIYCPLIVFTSLIHEIMLESRENFEYIPEIRNERISWA